MRIQFPLHVQRFKLISHNLIITRNRRRRGAVEQRPPVKAIMGFIQRRGIQKEIFEKCSQKQIVKRSKKGIYYQ